MRGTSAPIKTAAEQALADVAAAQGAICRAARRRGARGGVRAVRGAGLPHRRVEEWKYTDLRALMRDAKPLAARPTRPPRRAPRTRRLGDRRSAALVFADGHFAPGCPTARRWSRADHRRLATRSRRRALSRQLGKAARQDIAVALNTAFMAGGVVIHVRKDACIERPIHLASRLQRQDGGGGLPALAVIVEPGARHADREP